ncbi:VanW family protein [Prescottella agglutinans]|uniref:Vancomycin resistance protein YoaR n=1 Tax=Prescottella agglutinans TaxID=1644129 RepID=A0ABT6M832_9NOCA|nr:VanW family protein [Prescottella agglutinans]MDH6280463.1 vancomycin resistance protein YoaR [Prescottella agglutinans]
MSDERDGANDPENRMDGPEPDENPTEIMPVVPSDSSSVPSVPSMADAASDAPTEVFPATPDAGPDSTSDSTPDPTPEPEPEAEQPPEPEQADAAPTRRWVKYAAVAGGVAAVGVIAYTVDWVVSADRVPRGVTVAGVDIGGQSPAAAEETLRAALGPRVERPVPVRAGSTDSELVPAQAGVGVDWAATVDRAGKQPINPFTRLASLFTDHEIGVVSTVDDAALTSAMGGVQQQTDRAPREGNVLFEGARVVPVAPLPGQSLEVDAAKNTFVDEWALGTTVDLPVDTVDVTVTQAGVDTAVRDVAAPAVATDIVVTGKGGAVATLPRDQVGKVLTFVPDGAGGLSPQYNAEAATAVLAPQLASTEIKPKDAQITLSGGSPQVVPSVMGDMVQWPKTLEPLPALLAAPGQRTTPAIYEPAQPALTTEGANALGIREVIGEFTTGGFEYASGVNIRLAASAIDGAIVKPGETFSFDAQTGPRGSAQGYVDSGIINNGRPDKAVGGGISQLATTLYNATYFAGMEDVDHTEHSYYISRYPAAREATVFEGAIDLKFRNPSKTGVMIQTIGTSSNITVRIWGTKTVDVQSVTGNRTNQTSPNTITLPAGPHCVASGGAPGFTVSDTRIINDANSGGEVSRHTRTVKYDPVPIVKCVSNESAPTPPGR